MHLSFKQLQMQVTIQIVESNQGFVPLATVFPVQERNTSSVSTAALQSNASISMCNE